MSDVPPRTPSVPGADRRASSEHVFSYTCVMYVPVFYRELWSRPVGLVTSCPQAGFTVQVSRKGGCPAQTLPPPAGPTGLRCAQQRLEAGARLPAGAPSVTPLSLAEARHWRQSFEGVLALPCPCHAPATPLPRGRWAVLHSWATAARPVWPCEGAEVTVLLAPNFHHLS